MAKTTKAETPKVDRLPLGRFFAWKGRDVSMAAMQLIMTSYLLLFCTNILEMDPALVGGLLMASKIFDGVTDLFAGFLVDNTNTKWGRARPYELSIIGVWLCTVLMFSASPAWSMAFKSIWVFVMYTFVFSIFTTLLTAAQNPYMIRAFPSRMQVVKVSSYGGVVSMLGAMVVSVTFPILMGKMATSASGWQTLIMIYALPLLAIGILRMFIVKEDPRIDAGKEGQKVSLKEVFTMFKSNKYVWHYAAIVGLFNVIQGMNVAAQYFKYIVGDISLQSIIGMMSIIMLPVMFVFPKLMKKLSVANLIQLSAGLAIIGYALNFFAQASIPLLVVGNVLSGLAMLPLSYLGVVIIMNLSTFNESKGLQRMEGSTGIVANFTGKVFNGLGTGLVGILLGISGYISLETAVQPASSLFMIRAIYSLIPLACMAGILFFATKLSKLEKELPELEKGIAANKTAVQAEV